jgi:uncharacterized protein YbjQ (UPF0145 family)
MVFEALREVKFRPNLKLKTMKPIFYLTVGLAVNFAVVCPAQARNNKYLLSIKAALESTEVHEKSDGSVKFFFGKQPTPAVVTNLGTATFHGRINKRRSDDVKARNAAFLAALEDFQKRAKKAGANAVINVISYYKNVEMASPTEFECHAGAAAHAILRGNLVKIADE